MLADKGSPTHQKVPLQQAFRSGPGSITCGRHSFASIRQQTLTSLTWPVALATTAPRANGYWYTNSLSCHLPPKRSGRRARRAHAVAGRQTKQQRPQAWHVIRAGAAARCGTGLVGDMKRGVVVSCRDVGSPASIASERGDGERAAGGEDCVKPGPEYEGAAKDSPSLGLVWRSRGSVRLIGPTLSVCAATAGRA